MQREMKCMSLNTCYLVVLVRIICKGKKKKRSLDISNLVKSQTIHEQRQEHLMVQMNNEHLEICH